MSFKKNILVVDDSAVMRSLIVKTLRMSGVEIEEIFQAANGLEGLELLEKQNIDLLLVDINMPVMDGMEMLDRVRSNPETSDIPVLVISTESNEERISSFYKKEAAFIHKPFTPEDLFREISLISKDL